MFLKDHASDLAPHHTDKEKAKSQFWVLLLGCIGVVYGDIGTSPLYAFREAALQASKTDGVLSAIEIYGICSLILWSLMLVVTLKYVLFLLRLDNRGEGGILSLVVQAYKPSGKLGPFVFFMGLIGAGLFYGDAAITPAISVMSAVEGLKLATPGFEDYVLPISICILLLLFYAQKSGTGAVSIFFGPVTAVWFVVMGALGVHWIVQNPDILHALNPYYAVEFFIHHGMVGLIVLGAVFLAVTGAEALYADLGHFGRAPIQRAWLFLVFPCLSLNYLGQGALILQQPEALDNPFYKLAPEELLLPLILLATMATIVASQAVITGAYSLTRQAIQLGFLPRMEIRHTSTDQHGQIYMPKINRMLLLGVLLLCVMFGSSSGLASAYGIAVSGTMLVSTILSFIVIWRVWKKSPLLAALIALPFITLEVIFFAANMLKLFEGGIVPLLMAGMLVLMMTIWVRGTSYLRRKSQEDVTSLNDLVEMLDRKSPTRIEGTAIFLTSDPSSAPVALLQNLRHNHVLHQHNVILTVATSQIPSVPESHRIAVERLSSSITCVVLNFGYMEIPDVPKALRLLSQYGVDFDVENASYFLGRRSIVSDAKVGLPEWQDHIYIAMAKSAANANDFFRIPYDRVVEMGIQMAV
jgi:KUP system potassium uptake protein